MEAIDISMDPKDYNTEIAAKDTIVGGVYRSECNDMIVRIGEYAKSGTPKFVFTGSTSKLRVSPFSHETLYAQDAAMPEGAVRLGDLKVGEFWVNEKKDATEPDLIRCVRRDSSVFVLESSYSPSPQSPDTPVYPVEATFRLKGEAEAEPEPKRTCSTCNDRLSNAFTEPCSSCYHTASHPNYTPKQPDAKGKRFVDLEVGDRFVFKCSAVEIGHVKVKTGKYYYSALLSKSKVSIAPIYIVYPVKLTCTLEGN